MKKQRAPALPDSPTFQQLWDALGSKLIESAQGNLLYTLRQRGMSLEALQAQAGRRSITTTRIYLHLCP